MTTENTPTTTDDKVKKPLVLTDNIPKQGTSRLEPTAQRVGVSTQTLRRWWQNSQFPKPKRINGVLLFSNADLIQWFEKNGV